MVPRLTRLLAMSAALMSVVPALGFQQRTSAPPATAPTATVTGIVVSADATPQPLRRAIVSVRSNQAETNRSAITDDDGRFVIRQVPAGRVIISAIKAGYVATAYGATRPGRPGTPVALVAGQTFDATIAMSRSAVMAGVIRDERGQPLPGLRVYAIDARQPTSPSPVRSLTGTAVTTDDRGLFRLFDVVPGEYVIAAVPTTYVVGEIARRSESETELLLARLRDRTSRPAGQPASAAVASPSRTPPSTLSAVYFPGTPVLASAGRIKLAAGEIREGLDFSMTTVPVATIDGVVVNDAGPLPASVFLQIATDSPLQFVGFMNSAPRLEQRVDVDGFFAYSAAAPGHYVITARGDSAVRPPPGGAGGGAGARLGSPPPPPPPPPMPGAGGPPASADTMYGVEEFDVNGQPVKGLTIRLQRGSKLTGRLRFDAAALAAPADLASIRVSLLIAPSFAYTPAGVASSQSIVLGADGRFEFVGIAPGRYILQVALPTSAVSGWWLRSALVGDRDVLDSGLDVVLGTDIPDVILTMTDRHTELSGTLQTAAGLPATEYFVIVMPADPALRMKGSRRIKTTRPASDGRFSITDLPAGDYLLVALTDVEPNEWQLPEFLATIASAGVRISIGEGEKRTQNLRVEK